MSNLYETQEFPIQVTNKFLSAEWGEFEVNIIHLRNESQTDKKPKKSSKQSPAMKNASPKKKTSKNGKDDNDEDSEKLLNNKNSLAKIEEQAAEVFPSFFCRQYNTAKLRIKRGGTVNMNLIFLPLVLETQRCFIIFKGKQTSISLGLFQTFC